MARMPYSYTDARHEVIRHVPDSVRRVLDVGCLAGAFGKALKEERDAIVWGVEPMSGPARSAASCLDHVVNEYFVPEAEIPDAYFDAVVFNDSLEHFPDPEAALDLAKKKLVPGGYVICSLPNMLQIDNLEHLIVDRDWKYEIHGIRDRTHLRFFTQKSARRMFECQGFEIRFQAGINERWWRKDRLLRRLAFRLLAKFTDEFRYMQFLTIAQSRD